MINLISCRCDFKVLACESSKSTAAANIKKYSMWLKASTYEREERYAFLNLSSHSSYYLSDTAQVVNFRASGFHSGCSIQPYLSS